MPMPMPISQVDGCSILLNIKKELALDSYEAKYELLEPYHGHFPSSMIFCDMIV